MGSRSEYLMGEAQFLKNIGFRIQYFTISHIESSTPYPMSMVAIYRIANALDVAPYQLLKFD